MTRFDQFTHDAKYADESAVVAALVRQAELSETDRDRISAAAADLVRRIRGEASPTLMEHFLSEYGLSTREGVALMCLAEAMLRVPDAETVDALIEDKVAPSDWGKHLGEASSPLVNASTWALMLTGRVLDDEKPGMAGLLRGAIKRLGEPVIRTAARSAMKQMGAQFVLGETVHKALERGRTLEDEGYTYSYDMLGEAAMTRADADRYATSYEEAIAAIAAACRSDDVAQNPGISIKLSALHPRYEALQAARVMEELVPVVLRLAKQAKAGGMGLNIDAEEQDRLVLSLKVINAVLSSPELAGWDGFGVVVQAYGKRAGLVIDWLYRCSEELDRKIMVRLVKGAYWDTEMKHAQVEGQAGFPLFTSKVATDVSYISCARKLLGYADRIYPQFATHNAHSVAAILDMADGAAFEFQRLHGMGERLHDIVLKAHGTRCRIYAPVGAHRDLLAYLVRRLLENGANSSFVNQIVDEDVPPEMIATDPFAALVEARAPSGLIAPAALFGTRRNSQGFDLSDKDTLERISASRQVLLPDAAPITVRPATGEARPVIAPATGAQIGMVREADAETARRAIEDARPWDASPEERADVLRKVADIYEANAGVIFAALAREAGKSVADCVGELREAVDFLRYYAGEAEKHGVSNEAVITAISPWNFPLAIFTGQIAAALAAGNAVLAKPAEQTPVISCIAARLMQKAGVPEAALQLLPGPGETVGAALTSDARIGGVVFTGSTETAKRVQRSMAQHMAPGTPFVAETGGLNAMIVDSTALPEQAVRDIVASAFQSAGQRCSALRCLYVQADIAPSLIRMIQGAMDELLLGDPWNFATDVGPVIDSQAQEQIAAYVDAARNQGRVLHEVAALEAGTFIAPVMIEIGGIRELEREVFGPVLHVATFEVEEMDAVIADVNATGYGLTFGLHTRIDSRVQDVADKVNAGNIYVNRNQIGAVVGSQPFGGDGLSGTGPKAGGPLYLTRFLPRAAARAEGEWENECDVASLQNAIDAAGSLELSRIEMPGPTGEANTLAIQTRAPVLCLGPGPSTAAHQAKMVRALGGIAAVACGALNANDLSQLSGFSGLIYWGDDARDYAQALAARGGAILPLITGAPITADVVKEKHLCVDTTASGGNAALLAG